LHHAQTRRDGDFGSVKREPGDSLIRCFWEDDLEKAVDIRLLVLDIDGTIADKSNHIRDSVADAVRSAERRGVAVAVATGRLFQSSLHAYDSIGSTLPLICYEGALIREPKTGFVHRHWPIDHGVAVQILDHSELPGLRDRVSVHFHIQDEIYISNLNAASAEYFEASSVEPTLVNDLQPLLSQAITKVMVLSEEGALIGRLSSELKNSCCRTQVSQYGSMTMLEAFHPDVNKRLAVSYLAEEILKLRPENVMAIGDGLTDVEMLRYAGIGIAMENAPEAVKAIADWVTATIDEDGVATALERWILQAGSNPAPALAYASS
jgi:Cof subfamily protein (haloacid dehalogenase superfamily)